MVCCMAIEFGGLWLSVRGRRATNYFAADRTRNGKSGPSTVGMAGWQCVFLDNGE